MDRKRLLTSILKGKCPRCREGRIFKFPASRLSKFNKMNSQCPHCGIRLEPEPGFYQGAMYVGYGFTIFITIFISLLLRISDVHRDAVYIGTVIGVMIVVAPWNYRYSRIIYLYFFGGIKYDPGLSK
jgi:uncharacterized protein (DUF983 family)